MTKYIINTGVTSETNLSSRIALLLHRGKVGVLKQNQRGHIIKHELAQISAICQLAHYNLRGGFSRELCNAILTAVYSRVGFAESYTLTHDTDQYFDRWLNDGIIVQK